MKINWFLCPLLLLVTFTTLLITTRALVASGEGNGTLTAWGTGTGVIHGMGFFALEILFAHLISKLLIN